jgi:hypothetical protein
VGDVWLVPTPADAERLGIPRGQWLTPEHLLLLDQLEPAERKEVLQWMRAVGGIILTAPVPESPYGRGEAGYRRWRLENVARQAAEYRGRKEAQNVSQAKEPVSRVAPAPRCSRLPLLTGLCSACRLPTREVHIVRGRRQAFCSDCCPACSAAPIRRAQQ